MRLLSIDPGIRGCGAAEFENGKLVRAAYVKSPTKSGNGPVESVSAARAVFQWATMGIDILVLEYPKTYSGRAAIGDTNDLFALAAIDGALAAWFYGAEIFYYYPQQWKGQLPKPKSTKQPYVVENRVRRKLDSEELSHIEWPKNVKLTWDVSDAIGIGLFHLGRF